MSEMIIRRNSGSVTTWIPTKISKASAGNQVLPTGEAAKRTATDSLLQAVDARTVSGIKETRSVLQTGEAVLDELQNVLEQMEALVQDAAGESNPDKDALQEKLENLKQEIDRIIGGAVSGDKNLFLIDDSAKLPGWLTQTPQTSDQLLAALGLSRSASAGEILSAVLSGNLDSNSASGYLAALYLGAVIANSEYPETVTPEAAMAGLQRLLDKMAEGVPIDDALSLLTNGIFTNIEDFESGFLGGTDPNMQDFLMNILLANTAQMAEFPSIDLEFADFHLDMMGLFSIFDMLGSSRFSTENDTVPAALPMLAPENADSTAQTGAGISIPETAITQMGDMEIITSDLSSISFAEPANEITISGTSDVTVRSIATTQQSTQENNSETKGLSVHITGTGTATLQDTKVSLLTTAAPHTHIITAGKTDIAQIRIYPGTSLTISGDSVREIREIKAGRNSVLRMTGGAAIMQDGNGTLSIPVVLDGSAILSANAAKGVFNISGQKLEAFDIVWKTMLPGWSGLTGLEIDSKLMKFDFLNSSLPARLWLDKGDGSHGNPIHKLVLHGRDGKGQPKTRYAYLRWMNKGFQEIEMYPNPFTIIGGKENADWKYDGQSQSLRILTAKVTDISGGMGTDARMEPFSGRIALSDNIGTMELTLGGVICRVASGQAFDLGQKNDITLLLRSGAKNIFESGEGYAGVSLGDSTCLCIDCPDARNSTRNPDGKLISSGGSGGAGIGRDCNESKDRNSHILIRGGEITAIGTGGGAGIGAGKKSFMGGITITGGRITATGGKGGGAGIGAGLGAPVGNIRIQGGVVSATAAYHAAAIGAGIHGESGDILIAETARIVKAMGGDPGADIGACLFGKCGKVHIAANIGSARLKSQMGIGLQMGGDTAVLPRFKLSYQSLHLHKIGVTAKAYARTAKAIIEADRHLVSRMRESYGALYHQMEESYMRGVQRETGAVSGVVRDTAAAEMLLRDMKQAELPVQNRREKERMKKLFR